MRVLCKNNRYNHRPFQGQGASVYISVGTGGADPGPQSLRYRKLRVLGTRFVRGSQFTIANGLRKACVASQVQDPVNSISLEIPEAWHEQIGYIQLRTFWHDVESDITSDPVRVRFTAEGMIDAEIRGTAYIIANDKRDGGVYRIRSAYTPSSNGTQPATILIRKTSGPGTLADVETPYFSRTRNYDLDTPALTDGATYTFALVAKSGSAELQLDTITFTADAAGPPTPTNLTLTVL